MFDILKALSPSTIASIVLTLVLVVVAWRLNATGANWLLVLAWVLSAVSMYGALPSQPPIPRMLWTMVCASFIGLLFYYTLWTPPAASPRVPSHSVSDTIQSPKAVGDLRGSIDGIVVGDYVLAADSTQKFAMLMLAVTIRNTGPPTIVDGYQLFLKYPNGVTEEGHRQAIPSSFMAGYPDGTKEEIFGRDAIDRKTMQPIPTGSAQQGRLIYGWTDVTSEFIRGHAEGFDLKFKDAWGREYVVHHKISDYPIEIPKVMGYPGMTPPVEK